MGDESARMPSEVDGKISLFDRFASRAAALVSRAWFFVACVILVLVWAPSILIIQNVDTWQLIINSATTVITFLLVALLQNTQTRADGALQHKLNAIAEALGDLLDEQAEQGSERLRAASEELHEAVGLEDKESS